MRTLLISGFIVLLITLPAELLYAQEQNSNNPEELLKRIETLENQLRRIEEESKARKSLEVTEEEKVQKEKEVLSAVSREYSLDPKGTLALDYSLNYSYSPSEAIKTQDDEVRLERNADHTIQHSIYTSYSILDNLASSVTLPVVYRYNKQGTDDELDETDIGDISVGMSFQPVKSEAGEIRYTLSLDGTLPTGRSPFKINPDTEISTGSGLYSVSLGGSFSKQIDPVVLFWSVSYAYSFKKTGLSYRVLDQITLEKVEPGSTIEFGMGMGYALSYANSINISLSYAYQRSTAYYYKEIDSAIDTGDRVSASVGIGMGINLTPKTTVSVALGHSLTSNGFSVTTRVPFDFVL